MKRIFGLLLFFTLCINLPAQQYYFKQYSTQQGLPQSEVFKMIEDKKGNLWLATNGGGLARLDGERFTTFTREDGLLKNSIINLMQDSQENIWLAYLVGGIGKYDGTKFTHYQDDEGVFQNSQTFITALLEDKFKNIWIQTAQNTLFLKQGDKFINYSKGDSLVNANIPSFGKISLDRNKNLILSNAKGIQVFTGERFETKNIIKPELIKNKNLLFLYQDSQGIQWFAALEAKKPIQLFSYEKGNFNLFEFPSNLVPSLNVVNNFQMLETQEGLYWFMFNNLGVVKYDSRKETEQFILYTNQNGLPADVFTLNGLLSDREGNVWINTLGSGIIKFHDADFVNFFKKDGLPQELVRGLLQDSQGNIWIGTSSNGFCKYDGKKMIRFPISENPAFGRVWNFAEEEDGNILVATGSGLRRYHLKDKTYKLVHQEFSLPQVAIRSIFNEKNQLVFGSLGKGIFFYDKKTKKITKQLTNKDGLGENTIWDIDKDSKGNYWIATRNGLNKFDGNKLSNFKDIAVVSDALMLDICIDKNDKVWFVDYHTGLHMFDGQKTKAYTQNNGLAANLAYSVTCDQEGDIWIGTQRGLSELTLNETGEVGKIRNYNQTDGLLGDEMNGQSLMVDTQNNVWGGHIKGLSKYTPRNSTKTKISSPITKITHVTPYLKDIDWEKSTNTHFYDTLSQWNYLPSNLVLPYEKNNLSFYFASSSHTVPKRVRYQWRLDPMDKSWVSVTNKTAADYPNIPAGEYTFQVRSMNHLGAWGEATAYSFKIAPPFWLTWWFITLLVLIALSLVFLIVWARVKIVEEQKQELQRLVEERTAEVVKKKDEILEKNIELEQQQEEIIAQNEKMEKQAGELYLTNYKISQKNRKITASITYAKRIQDVMLPLLKHIQEALPESFVFYRPRDIVSGDFYWFHKKNDKIIIAAVDCTGHGVPGAFLSLVASNLLHNIIVNKGIFDPSRILNLLHFSVFSYLKQNETHNQDGMDIALCCIDKKERTVSFAGAKNPLVYVKKDELKIFKGIKNSIGGFSKYSDKQLNFKNHVVQLDDEPTTFYLYTDGFQDQFGGKKGEKFRTVPFRSLLREISQEPVREQKGLLKKAFEDWKGKGKQIDDILVLGFKI
jgi:ligand-binding sensor domain-containing protein/serine phosphatase RsbU (regulator of sigma subunit)